MSIKRRGKVWHIDVIQPDGTRLRRSAQTTDRKAAQELHDQLKAQNWRQEMLGEKPPRSLDEAADRFLAERAHEANAQNNRNYLAFWKQRASGMALTEITRSWALEQLDTSLALSTRKNYLGALSGVLKAAWLDWEWIDANTPLPSFRLPKERKAAPRGIAISPDQARALLAVLPAKYRAPVAFGFLTGLRCSNIFGLTWDHVNLEQAMAWIDPQDAKAGRRIVVPLNTAALEILRSQPNTPGESRVFPTNPPKWKTWKSMVKRAGLPAGFRFHDIRHTFASWLSMAGVERKTVQELAGWSCSSMLDNYVHLPAAHLATASQGLADRLTAQLRHIDHDAA